MARFGRAYNGPEVGNGWAEGVHPDDSGHCLQTYVSAFDAREPFSVTYRLRRHDGVYRDILDNGAPFYRAGVFAGYFGRGIDVTEKQATEAELRQAQKTHALGKLTGGVAATPERRGGRECLPRGLKSCSFPQKRRRISARFGPHWRKRARPLHLLTC